MTTARRKVAVENVPPYLFYGPERPSDPGGIGLYTSEAIEFRGYTLWRRNLWGDRVQEWHCRDTALSAVGPGAEPVPFAMGGWRARVAGVVAEGATMREALEEAWAGATFEDQLRHLLPPGGG